MLHYPLRAIDPTQQYVHCVNDDDVNYWSERLKISADELRSTAREVGEKLIDIEACVRQRKRSGSSGSMRFSQSASALP